MDPRARRPFTWKRRSIARCATCVREKPVNSKQIGIRRGQTANFGTALGIVTQPLRAVSLENGKVRLSGSFGVFFAGKLVAHFYNEHDSNTGTLRLAEVDPTDLVVLDTETAPQGKPTRVSLHLEDQGGLDRGALQEVPIRTGNIH